jgi:hypothetical protein
MKKVSLLLLSVLLLLPVAIYFGNVADIPVSKKIIVHLRNLVGMSASKETIEKIPPSYIHIGLVESWRNLGADSFADLLQFIATPASLNVWRANAGDFLGDSLHSTAFFSSSWSFWQAQQEKLSLVGYYQPWTDILLLIQVTEIDRRYKTVAMGLTEPNRLTFPTTPTAMAQELTARLKHAEQVFRIANQNPAAISSQLNAAVIKKSQDSLNEYVINLRDQLVATSAKNPTDTSLAVLEWLDSVHAGQVKEVQALAQPSSEWFKQLQIVYLIEIDAENCLLAASNYHQPELVLLVQLHITEHKAQATELQIWDAATAAGDTQ